MGTVTGEVIHVCCYFVVILYNELEIPCPLYGIT